MDLSNTFDTINHDIFLFKSKAYGFKKNSGFFIRSYLTNKCQRAKIGNNLSDWNKIITMAAQSVQY